ncbi:MAG: translocation/assembly module TamB domain-containing protein [Burkholderiaceae bacterium]|nr:translocation/assembly module TamB domain-containing protein [Burkholderiaceae bacterium]
MSAAQAPSPANPAPRRRPWIGFALLLALLALLLTTGLGITQVLRSEAGTRWLLARVPGLQVQGVRGALWSDGLSIERLLWQGGAQQPTIEVHRIELAQPRWRWLPHAGAWLMLTAPSLTAERVAWQSPRESGPAGAPPTQLRLPFALQIDALQVAQLQLDAQAPWLDLRAGLHIGGADGTEHRISALSMRNDRLRIGADARLGSAAPLPLALQLRAEPVRAPRSGQVPGPPPEGVKELGSGPSLLGGTPWQAQVQADGPLANFNARATLRSDVRDAAAPSLDAQARIQTFAAWPLAELQLSTRAIDLAAFSSAAPQTRLDAQAQVQTSGLDRPAQASITVHNQLPGRLDANRLPVRELRLQLAGTPAQLDRIDITQWQALLADDKAAAGRLQGSGQWSGSDLRLDLQLSNVEPARLHRAAAPMRTHGKLALQLRGVPLPTAAAPAPPVGTAPPWSARIDGALEGTLLSGAGKPVRAELQLALSADTVELTRLRATSADASAQATLKAVRSNQGRARAWQLQSQGELARFDPLVWWPGTPESAWSRGPHRFSGRWQLDAQLPETLADQLRQDVGSALASMRGQAQLDIADSQLAGVPIAASVAARGDGRALALNGRFGAADNQLAIDGALAAEPAADRWKVDAAWPALAALKPIALLSPALPPAVWPVAGAAQLQGVIEGRWPALGGRAMLRTQGLQIAEAVLQDGQAEARFTPGADPSIELTAALQSLSQGEQRLDELQARVSGSLRAHQLSLSATSPVRPPAWTENLLGSTAGGTRLSLDGRAAWRAAGDGGGTWRAEGTTLRIGARNRNGANDAWVAASELDLSVQLNAARDVTRAELAPGRVTLPGGAALRWTQAAWRAEGRRFDLSSELEPFAVAPVLARLQPELGWGGDLRLAGRIEVHAAERFDADILLARSGGDLRVADESGRPQSLDIGELQLAFQAHNGVWRFAQGVAGSRFGEMGGAQTVRTNAQARWPAADAPLEGVLQMRVANLAAWGVWVPPGWRLGGSLQVTAEMGGRFGAPELRGQMRGDDLSVRNVLLGVNVTEGELAASLDGAVARVQRMDFKGGDGHLRVSGEASLGASPSARLRVAAEQFRLLARIDRRLVASGGADLQLTRNALKLDGRFVVDEGLIDVSNRGVGGLDDDVVVVRAASAPQGASAPIYSVTTVRDPRKDPPLPAPLRNAQVDLVLGLGEKLQVRGRGLDASLRGDLRITSPAGRMAVNGTVRTDKGTYVAYAQKLVIERGELVFTGNAENPRLDILAIRPNLDVRVGVAVTGPLANPRVQLFSEPVMSEMDKLSWLMLGRASEGLGRDDTALLQRAALALLAGDDQGPTDQLLSRLGLTDFSVRQESEGQVRETIVSLGKQLSQRWYVGYERSVNATAGSWQLVYRIAQRFTVRAQSGEENALDLIWSWRW